MRLFFLRRLPGPINRNDSPEEFFAMKLSEHLRSTHCQDGAVVLDICEGKIFRINLVGSRIVELLRMGLSESEIVQRLTVEFAVERTTVTTDVREFLEQLRQLHLLDGQEPESHVAR
jgi:Coenzyme PQQ synthesis protein D (PqqD)